MYGRAALRSGSFLCWPWSAGSARVSCAPHLKVKAVAVSDGGFLNGCGLGRSSAAPLRLAGGRKAELHQHVFACIVFGTYGLALKSGGPSRLRINKTAALQ